MVGTLKIGAHVRLEGLCTTQLNGAAGVVTDRDAETQRWGVSLLSPLLRGIYPAGVRVREANLVLESQPLPSEAQPSQRTPPKPLPLCSVCVAVCAAGDVRCCSACGTARYCSEACEKSSRNKHSTLCSSLAEGKILAVYLPATPSGGPPDYPLMRELQLSPDDALLANSSPSAVLHRCGIALQVVQARGSLRTGCVLLPA
jgi:hypothetical protein